MLDSVHPQHEIRQFQQILSQNCGTPKWISAFFFPQANQTQGSNIIHPNIATCKWWRPLILLEKARFRMVAKWRSFKEPIKTGCPTPKPGGSRRPGPPGGVRPGPPGPPGHGPAAALRGHGHRQRVALLEDEAAAASRETPWSLGYPQIPRKK